MASRATLSTCLFLGLLSVTSAAQSYDRQNDRERSSCAQLPKAAADRCMATAPETVVYGAMSDHGSSYDAQGNAIDRQGNIVATPSNRSGDREVFAYEPGLRR